MRAVEIARPVISTATYRLSWSGTGCVVKNPKRRLATISYINTFALSPHRKSQYPMFTRAQHTRSSGGPSKRVVLRHSVNQQRIWGNDFADKRREQVSDANWWCDGGAGGRSTDYGRERPPLFTPHPLPHRERLT